LSEQPLAVAVAVLGQADRAMERQRVAKQRLALAPRALRDVLAAGVEDVEQVEVQLCGVLAALLEDLERRLAAGEGHDLAVDDEPGCRVALQRAGDGRKALVEAQL